MEITVNVDIGKTFDNISDTVRDDLAEKLTKGCKLAISAERFSMYAYRELKAQLDAISECRFLFTSPTFVTDKADKQKREFYIPRLSRETSLYGTEYELRLRNELTQKAVARECAEWIRKKVRFKSNTTGESMNRFLVVSTPEANSVYLPFNSFTTTDLGCERGNSASNYITRLPAQGSDSFINLFDNFWNNKDKYEDVTEAVIENIATAYGENSPEFIYFMMLYHVFSEFLEDISEDELPNSATGFKESKIWSMLYDFQRDAVLAIINKLERYNGCILADSVGLGKTFTALAVIKYYQNRNKSILVLCPKKLADNWKTYKDNYINNPIAADRLNYDVLFHTDMTRTRGESNGLDLDRINWGNYDLVVIDESHSFRNGTGTHLNTQTNRYDMLMRKVIQAGVKTKVLMLSATPVNNRFLDLKNQIALAYEGVSANIDKQLNTTKSIDMIFRQAQMVFNEWNKMEPHERTTQVLLEKLDFDFFELLDSVTIARSRKHIEKYYDTAAIGKFPTRRKPISLRPCLTDLQDAINYNEIYEQLIQLHLSIYTPSHFIHPSKRHKYLSCTETEGAGLSRAGREDGIRRLMRINLLKRLESSVNSFQLTLKRIRNLIKETIEAINRYELYGYAEYEVLEAAEDDLDTEDSNTEFATIGGRKFNINFADMDYRAWRNELLADAVVFDKLTSMIADITPEHDSKLQSLLALISQKIETPINPGNKKVLIFSAFSDTAEYLYEHVSRHVSKKHGLHTAVVTGSIDGKSTIKGFQCSLNNVLTCFSPKSKGKDILMPERKEEIDILIASDCISEGQNLQDCDYVVNYDIHWNPVRIIQRFGRVDRIGSRNQVIQLVNFWPDMDLDEYIDLKARVETRMKITVMTSTGDDNPIDQEEKGDLEYRRQQLKRFRDEVVDIEDMTTGISIMDLGLNEFRLDLLDYMNTHGDLDKKPKGMHAVVPATDELPPGVIFVLKNVNHGVNIDQQNRIHPFYLVYMGEDGSVISDYLHPKQTLDDVRLLCKGRSEPMKEVYPEFNRLTKDGRDMKCVSQRLSEAIHSIIQKKEQSDIDSLFGIGGTFALLSSVTGLDDFELICFLVIQ